MKKKKIIIWCVIALLIIGNVFQFFWNHSRLFRDAVPDEETAIVIAETVLDAMYGFGESFLRPSPPASEWLVITLDATFDSFRRAWVVSGSLPEPPDGYDAVLGTVPEVTIRMRDAKIMSIRWR